jgi:hypothetical protein
LVEAFAPPARIENPDLFPAWAWLRPPDDFNAPYLRGELFFETAADMGLRVQTIAAGAVGDEARVAIWRPWTYVVLPLPASDVSGWIGGLPDHCSVIMDCHFPIMDMETAVGSADQLVEIIDQKDMLLANLALADVVTVPRPVWAEALARVNPNVFVLPDFDEARPDAFGLRMVEIALASVRVARARAAACEEMGL